ncbi:hypothetical protein B0H14DRAFT_3621655 [Mycena olivaceomarginata]|nr:hypothetical protein B0H14DRAFT_3621655 [Mycena olivaceomarginata]
MSEQLQNLQLGYETLEWRHQTVIPADEFSDLQQSIEAMTAALEDAVSASADPSTQPMLSVMPVIPSSQCKRGRPRKDIDKEFLAGALALRGPAGIAKSLDCHVRTGLHVLKMFYSLMGHLHRIWQSTGPPISAISNMPEHLDQVMADILIQVLDTLVILENLKSAIQALSEGVTRILNYASVSEKAFWRYWSPKATSKI